MLSGEGRWNGHSPAPVPTPEALRPRSESSFLEFSGGRELFTRLACGLFCAFKSRDECGFWFYPTGDQPGRPEAAWEARWDPVGLALSPAPRTGCIPGHGRYGRADISRVNPGGGSQSPAGCPAPGHCRRRLGQPQPCAGTHRPLRASASLMLFYLPLTT